MEQGERRMTKEELEKEAEKFLGGWLIDPEIVKLLVDFAEPREKRIAELIALINAERERQEKCDDVHLRTIAELEKENAELKKQLEMSNKVYNDNLDYSHHIEEQLTKAKEIIKAFLDSSDLNIKHKAEEFLGEF